MKRKKSWQEKLEAQAAHLREEGHTIKAGKDGKPRKVKDFEQALVGV